MFFRRPILVTVFCLMMVGCGGNPYLDASLDPAEFEGRDQAWFEEHWGIPNGKSKRFFGGETWVYHRIAGGENRFPFYNYSPNTCEIELNFDDDGKLDSYDYSDC